MSLATTKNKISLEISNPLLQGSFYSNMSVSFFDNLGSDGFRDFLNEVLSGPEQYGKSFIPGPAGKDGGIDGHVKENKTKIVFQYKFHEISRISNAKLQKTVLNEFTDCINKELVASGIKDSSISEVIFITNVELSKTTREKAENFSRNLRNVNLTFWDFTKLKINLQACEDGILKKFFPIEIANTVMNIEKLLKKQLVKSNESPKVKISKIDSDRVKEFFVDKELRSRCYYALLLILSPVIIGDSLISERLREFLDINRKTEKAIIRKLKRENKISFDDTDKIAYIKNKNKALENFEEISNIFPVDLSKIIEIFS